MIRRAPMPHPAPDPHRAPRYDFRRVRDDDLPMLRRWLATPAAREWWGDPVREEALLRADLDEPAITMLIVALDGDAFAFAQHYAVHTWPQPQFAHLPRGARAIDTFIGAPNLIGRGHGAAYLRILAAHLRGAGVPLVAIEPDIRNLRARRAYAAAGFRVDVPPAPGARPAAAPAPAVVMVFDD